MDTSLDTMFSLKGKRALITGASSGIGWHLAHTMVQAGVESIAIAARRTDRLNELTPLLQKINPKVKVYPIEMDVSKVSSIKKGFEYLDQQQSVPCDVIICNAGISISGKTPNVSEEDYDTVMNINTKGAFFVAQEGAARMISFGIPGSIVHVSSILGFRVGTGLNVYAASKAAISQHARATALDLVKHKIRCNALCPGYFETEMNYDFFQSARGQKFIQEQSLSKRLGNLHELDGPLLLLASDAGSYITGTTLVVDGGHLCSSL